MSFIVTRSSFVRLWLFVPLVRLGNAQVISSNTRQADFDLLTCGEDQFECQNQQCIRSELLCDGRADCSDSSDETEFECSKPELVCPDYAFRCKYGACIDQDLVCNDNVDCIADGSDENILGACYSASHPGTNGLNYRGNASASNFPSYPGNELPILGHGVSYASDEDAGSFSFTCLVPSDPINGRFKLRRISDTDDIEYIDPPSITVETGGVLICTCDPGYKVRGNPLVNCSLPGTWSPKPVCIETRCRPLTSVSTTAKCIYASGREKPCSDDYPVRPETKATLSCRPGYRAEFTSPVAATVECNKDGKWKPEPIRCEPVCGKANLKSPATGETTYMNSTFPWHAALYVQETSLRGTDTVFRCDLTIVRADLLLTTARCVQDFIMSWDPLINNATKPLEILEKFLITIGNIDHSLLLRDSQLITKHRVKNVHTTCSFYGKTNSYATDVALIELFEPLEFSDTLLPACLDEVGFVQQILRDASYEGLSDSRVSPIASQIPQTITVLDMPHSKCVTLYNATRSPFRVNDSKFCDSNNNGIASCMKDVVNDGGGLVFELNNVWYLAGIVSQISSSEPNGGERLCDRDLKLLYNEVSEHMTWIQQVISNLEHFKYPPCSRYLPPFHTKPATLVSTSAPMTTTMTSSTQSHVEARLRTESCSIPAQPINGEWRLHEDFCEDDTDCIPAEMTSLVPGSQLVYSCAPGYKVEGNTDVYCRANGMWSSVPVCTEIECISLTSLSMAATCSRFGEWVDCNFPVLPKTRAKVTCRSGYRAEITQGGIAECTINGNWEPGIPVCKPVCGATFGSSQLFLSGEVTTATYPWHATLYVQKNTSMTVEKEVRCGATLIQSNLLLTAAHCVYNEETRTTEDPRRLLILMSNIHRHYDSPLHDFHSVRRAAVRNVYVHCNYHGLAGNYVADIALLELQEPFEFFNVQLYPACLDFSGYNTQVLGPGASGAFNGFGKTATGEPSDVLQTITLPYVSQTQCKSSNITSEKQALITSDKFCAGYDNGTAVCLGDGGGGLFIQINGLWFVMGVVSVDLSKDWNSGEDTCKGGTHMLYTKVSDYMAWILDVMFHLERYKSYSQCG